MGAAANIGAMVGIFPHMDDVGEAPQRAGLLFTAGKRCLFLENLASAQLTNSARDPHLSVDSTSAVAKIHRKWVRNRELDVIASTPAWVGSDTVHSSEHDSLVAV